MTAPADNGPSHREVLALALPLIASNVTTPLLGLVDTWAIGRLPDPAGIGAVAMGSLLFTFVFWAFGFLRMATTGLTAQALGEGDRDELRAGLGRALLVAGIAGAGLVVLGWPLRGAAFALLDGSDRVESLAGAYFGIRIFSAPAALANYAFLGWFIGLGRTRVALGLQLLLNVTNIVLDATLVLGFGWGVEGVAAGTLVAEWVAAVAGGFVASGALRTWGGLWDWRLVLDRARLERTFRVSGDIMVRSLALLAVFLWFMNDGAGQGDRILAANAVLMQLISVSAFFLDGMAFAAESLVGRAVGAGDSGAVRRAVVRSTAWATGLALTATVVLFLFGSVFIDGLTVDPATRSTARTYLPWAAAAPLAGVLAFQLDGVFIGATRTAEMRNAMVVSFVIFVVAWWLLRPVGNHGLWASLFVHYAARTLTLAVALPPLLRLAGPPARPTPIE